MSTILRYADRAEWLQSRTKGIGASEVSVIMGVNPFETPYQLWRRKKGLDAPKEETEAMLRGHILEEGVAQYFHEKSGYEIIKSSADDFMYVDTEKPFLRASPDRLFWLGGKKSNKNKGILECKTTLMSVDAENIPRHWYCQVQYNLGVSGFKRGALAWLSAGHFEFGYIEIEFDAEFYAYMVERVAEFWERYIIGDEEPAAETAADVLIKYPTHAEGEEITATVEVMQHWTELHAVKEEIAELEKRKAAAEDGIKIAMGECERIVDASGGVLATWKAPKPTVKFNANKFKAAEPDMYANFCEESQGARRFLLK